LICKNKNKNKNAMTTDKQENVMVNLHLMVSGFGLGTCYTVIAMLTVTLCPPAKGLIEYLRTVHL